MPYNNRFIATDNLIAQLQPVIAGITDQAILASYAGFLSVSAVTVYELAIKDIFNEFAGKKHKVFGIFSENSFKRINGRIKMKDLKDQHIILFGDNYLKRFKRVLKKNESTILQASQKDITSCYNNLILCRHEFVHRGTPTLTAPEVMDSYEYGKHVLHSLNETMRR